VKIYLLLNITYCKHCKSQKKTGFKANAFGFYFIKIDGEGNQAVDK